MDARIKKVLKSLTQFSFGTNTIFMRIVSPIFFPRSQSALFVDFINNKAFVLAPAIDEATVAIKLIIALISVMSKLEEKCLIYVSDKSFHSDCSIVYGDKIVLDSHPLPSRYESKDDNIVLDQESSTRYTLKDGDCSMLSFELPEQLFNPLSQYLFSIIYPTNDLDRYVSYGFMEEEEYRTRKALKNSRIAIIVAILIGVISPFASVLIANHYGKTTLDETQLSLIINSIGD